MKNDPSVQLCVVIKGKPLAEALQAIAAAECTFRYIYLNGKNLINDMTNDYIHTRINLRVERDLIKHARVG